jgi:hypothetical protein
MKEALNSSETSVLARTTLRNIQEDAILHSHRRKNLILQGLSKNKTQVKLKNTVFTVRCRMDHVRTEVPEERIASIIRVTTVGELGITLSLTSNRSALRRNNNSSCINVRWRNWIDIVTCLVECRRC